VPRMVSEPRASRSTDVAVDATMPLHRSVRDITPSSSPSAELGESA